MTALVLGMGNPILTDDAVGVRLAMDFARRLEGMEGVHVEPECCVGGLNLIDVLQGYAQAIVLDSVQTTGAAPGRWHYFDARALRETIHLTNIHDANFATALALGHRLGLALPMPEDVHVFAVEIHDAVTFSDRMTPALEHCFPALSNEIFSEVSALLGLAITPGSHHDADSPEQGGECITKSSPDIAPVRRVDLLVPGART